jgi:predicted CoA-binding protein
LDTNVAEFLQAKKIAVFGVSRDPRKFGHIIYIELKQRGYKVVAVNPNVDQIDGDPCYPSLLETPTRVDAVVVVVPPQHAAAAVEQAARLSIPNLWLTPGSESKSVLELAHQKGINPIHNRCVLMYLEPVKSVHAFHRFFARLFGKI